MNTHTYSARLLRSSQRHIVNTQRTQPDNALFDNQLFIFKTGQWKQKRHSELLPIFPGIN
jgi:hypothetical protein